MVTAKNLLEFYDIDVSPKKFKLKVRLPRAIRKSKEALTKELLIDILNSIADMRLKTYLLLLSATGMRASEALSISICDLLLNTDLPRVFVRGDTSSEITNQFQCSV